MYSRRFDRNSIPHSAFYNSGIQQKASEIENEELKRFQKRVNVKHPFGIRLWKPALYQKYRSIEGNVALELQSLPSENFDIKTFLNPGNILWFFVFGWILCLAYTLVAVVIFLPISLVNSLLIQSLDVFNVDKHRKIYKLGLELSALKTCSEVLISAGLYFLWPFNNTLKVKEAGIINKSRLNEYSGRISNHQGDPDSQACPLLSGHVSESNADDLYSLIEYKLAPGACIRIYRCIYMVLLAPLNLVASLCCIFLVFFIPMTQLNIKVVRFLYRNPFNIRFPRYKHRESIQIDMDNLHIPESAMDESNLLLDTNEPNTVICIKSAFGVRYYKYTIKGVNIIFVNLSLVAVFAIVDHYLISAHVQNSTVNDRVIFYSALLSTIPLAYFIGMSVAAITSLTGSIGLGAIANATFGSIVEIILYIISIKENKVKIVEGAVIGSLIAGLLALPGFSMISGSIRKYELTFNSKLAGLTCTIVIGAMIAAFIPTLFQKIHGSHGIFCTQTPGDSPDVPPLSINTLNSLKPIRFHGCIIVRDELKDDLVYRKNTRLLTYVCSLALMLIYFVGLYFSWLTSYKSNKIISKPKDKNNTGVNSPEDNHKKHNDHIGPQAGRTPDESPQGSTIRVKNDPVRDIPNPSSDNQNSINDIRRPSGRDIHIYESRLIKKIRTRTMLLHMLILIGCTVTYSFIAEIIVSSIYNVIPNSSKYPKLIGLTVFALIPMTTEFYNAVAFALNSNIGVSLEIGTAYMTQALMIQIPVLVAYTAINYKLPDQNQDEFGVNLTSRDLHQSENLGFTMIFTNWDISVLAFSCLVFLRVYNEGRSNFFKGFILIVTYIIVVISYVLISRPA